MSSLRQPRARRLLGGVVSVVLATASALALAWHGGLGAGGQNDFTTLVRERRLQNYRLPIAYVREKLESGEANREILAGPAQEDYENRAYPSPFISLARAEAAARAYNAVDQRTVARRAVAPAVAAGASWKELGPITPVVAAVNTYTGRETTTSGRVTSLAISPGCSASKCTLYTGAAGGGIWKTDNGLAAKPSWKPWSNGIPSNAIGVIVVDPSDASGKTLYVGTGEPNGSSDSEAGVGLYKSTDGGASWALVPGSLPVAKDRSISMLVIDPANPKHLYMGTAVARHGSSSVNGGRFTPPDAPQIGLYESTDGGMSFTLAFSQPADEVDPGSPNGSDFFSGGVTDLALDPRDPATVYVGLFNYGVWRRSARLDGNADFHQIFAPVIQDALGERIDFAVVEKNNTTRVYVGAGSAQTTDDAGNTIDGATLWRVDNANVPAASLSDGTNNAGWTQLSNPANGTPGFASFDFCSGQCSYDMFVASPPGRPDELWIGGQMQYNELIAFGSPFPRSNGRAVQRSTDGGVSFTDMTADGRDPPEGMHPDQHAIVFGPGDMAFVGSDGGVVRTGGAYVDRSAECAERGLAGADLADCLSWLKAVPKQIDSLNDGLATLQFQSVSVNGRNAPNDILGGTQDNGTWAFRNGGKPAWFETIGGDGGQSGINVGNPDIRMHSYYDAQHDVNFRGNDPLGWNWISDRLLASGEAQSFYVPLIADPRVSGSWFVGLQHVWRTKDNGGSQAFLEKYCNEYTGDYPNRPDLCGDWETLGGPPGTGEAGDLTSPLYGADKGGSYVVATERARADRGTLWVGTRRGRLFISKNADAASAADVSFTRIDSASTPTRFISGIAIDRNDPNHAWVSFSGYNAYATAAGTAPGHVFEVTYNPASGTAAWKDISTDLGDQPITDIALDHNTGDLFAATDFGVLRLAKGASSWETAAPGLPPVAVYGLTTSPAARTLFAATHGRGVWRLRLE